MPLSMLGRGFSGLMYASEKVVRVVRSSQKPHWYPMPIQILRQWRHGCGGLKPMHLTSWVPEDPVVPIALSGDLISTTHGQTRRLLHMQLGERSVAGGSKDRTCLLWSQKQSL